MTDTEKTFGELLAFHRNRSGMKQDFFGKILGKRIEQDLGLSTCIFVDSGRKDFTSADFISDLEAQRLQLSDLTVSRLKAIIIDLLALSIFRDEEFDYIIPFEESEYHLYIDSKVAQTTIDALEAQLDEADYLVQIQENLQRYKEIKAQIAVQLGDKKGQEIHDSTPMSDRLRALSPTAMEIDAIFSSKSGSIKAISSKERGFIMHYLVSTINGDDEIDTAQDQVGSLLNDLDEINRALRKQFGTETLPDGIKNGGFTNRASQRQTSSPLVAHILGIKPTTDHQVVIEVPEEKVEVDKPKPPKSYSGKLIEDVQLAAVSDEDFLEWMESENGPSEEYSERAIRVRDYILDEIKPAINKYFDLREQLTQFFERHDIDYRKLDITHSIDDYFLSPTNNALKPINKKSSKRIHEKIGEKLSSEAMEEFTSLFADKLESRARIIEVLRAKPAEGIEPLFPEGELLGSIPNELSYNAGINQTVQKFARFLDRPDVERGISLEAPRSARSLLVQVLEDRGAKLVGMELQA